MPCRKVPCSVLQSFLPLACLHQRTTAEIQQLNSLTQTRTFSFYPNLKLRELPFKVSKNMILPFCPSNLLSKSKKRLKHCDLEFLYLIQGLKGWFFGRHFITRLCTLKKNQCIDFSLLTKIIYQNTVFITIHSAVFLPGEAICQF